MKDESKYVKIAHWYYNLGLTQDEIAKRLFVTRQRVNQIISSLSKKGIVTIKVNGFERGNVKSETLIEEQFGIKQVIVADTYGETGNYLPSLAVVAADYLDEAIKQKMIVGITWGTTLSETISRMSFTNKSECMVVQMFGLQSDVGRVVKSADVTRELSDKLDCPGYLLFAPALVEHERTKDSLMNERKIKESFAYMKQCDMALFGIGEISPDNTFCKYGIGTKEDIDKLEEEGFKGLLCLRPIREDGSDQGCFLENRIIGVGIETIRHIPNVVAVAGGKHKAQAIISCLRTGCIDTLIIDDSAADEILRILKL